jgi:hypothetical protein
VNWGELAECCAQELERMRAGLPDAATYFPSAHNVISTLLHHEQSTDGKVSAAIRQFAARRTWPPLTDLERTMLCFRLEWAADLADLLWQQPRPWSDTNDPTHDEERLGWVMLFAWSHVGFPRLHESLQRLLQQRGGA